MKVLILDLFGTLVPTECDDDAHRELARIVASMHGLRDSWYELYELYRRFVSIDMDSCSAVKESYRSFVEENNLEPLYTYEELCWLHTWLHASYSKLYPDVVPFLENVRRLGLEIVIVSDASRDVGRAIVKSLGLDRWVRTVVAFSDLGITKPNPKLLTLAENLLGTKLVPVAVVGDSEKDHALADALGVPYLCIDRKGKRSDCHHDLNTLFEELKRIVAR